MTSPEAESVRLAVVKMFRDEAKHYDHTGLMRQSGVEQQPVRVSLLLAKSCSYCAYLYTVQD